MSAIRWLRSTSCTRMAAAYFRFESEIGQQHSVVAVVIIHGVQRHSVSGRSDVQSHGLEMDCQVCRKPNQDR